MDAFKKKIFQKLVEHSSIKVMNKIARTGINLYLIFNFYSFLKTKMKINRIF